MRPTRAEIDLAALQANATRLRERVASSGAQVIAVVKADAYGHGAVPVARALAASGQVRGLAVSLAEEALELRHAGVRGELLVLGGVFGGAHEALLSADVTPVVSDLADLEHFARAGASLGRPAAVHLKIDTGMSRLGIRPADVPQAIQVLARHPAVQIVGLCTHLASADTDAPATLEQLRRFEQVRSQLAAAGISPPLVHVANSAATFRFPASHFGAVRPGLALYGGGAPAGVSLDPVMRLVTGIAQLRTVDAGDTVSYGGLWKAPVASRIATLPIGYADGYPRRLTGRGEVLVHGRRCAVVGAICMDMTLVDVTALGDTVHVGDDAVLLGQQGDERILAAELAERAGLIEYEITCGISKRVPRSYLGGA